MHWRGAAAIVNYRPVLSPERASHINKPATNKIWFWAPDGCLTPRYTGRLTGGRSITFTLTWVAVRELLGFSSWELLLLESGSWSQGQFGNPEEGERQPLEAATKQRQWRRPIQTPSTATFHYVTIFNINIVRINLVHLMAKWVLLWSQTPHTSLMQPTGSTAITT
jgi:hypothetical protein